MHFTHHLDLGSIVHVSHMLVNSSLSQLEDVSQGQKNHSYNCSDKSEQQPENFLTRLFYILEII